jgi:hypothetical protein
VDGRIRYILRRLKGVNYGALWDYASKIHQKTGRNTLLLALDIAYCSFKYGTTFTDYFEFEFYLLNSRERLTYLTSSINNDIVRKYNDPERSKIFHDKLVFNEHFKRFLKRDYVDIRKDDLDGFVKKHPVFIAKPVDESGGLGIRFYDVKEYPDTGSLKKVLMENRQYLLEEPIIQEKSMNDLNPSSVNTLRIISFLKDDGSAVILKRIILIGNKGKVNNFTSGGMYSFLDENGTILYPAIDKVGNIFPIHPTTGIEFAGYRINRFEEACELVKELARVIPEVRYVGWDIAISENGPLVIEGNEYSGVFEAKPSLSKVHKGDLALYRQYMEI